MFEKYDTGHFISMATLVATGAIVSYFCMIVFWYGDDISYQYDCRYALNSVPIESFGDVIESQYAHYFRVNGRVVAHFIVQLFDGLLSKSIFAACNGIVNILFLRMMMLTCGVSMNNWRGTLTLSLLVLTCLSARMSPAFQMYIWMYLLVLVYLRIFFHYHTERWWLMAILGLFSVACGNAHESINVGICVALGIYAATHLRRMSLLQWVMMAGFAIGFCIWMFTPATGRRLSGGTPPMILEYRVLSLLNSAKSLVAFYILVTVVAYRMLKRREGIKSIYAGNEFWWNTWIAITVISLIIGYQGSRALLGEEAVAIILTIRMLRNRSFSSVWLVVLCVAAAIFMSVQWMSVRRANSRMKGIMQQFSMNESGNVYLDPPENEYIEGDKLYAAVIPLNNTSGYVYYLVSSAFGRHLKRELGITDSRELHLYPTPLKEYIEGDAYEREPNKLVTLSPQASLLIQSKECPARFKALMHRNIPGFYKEYPPIEVTFDEVIYETDKWRARIVTPAYYESHYPATFIMEPPQSATE